MSRNLLLMTLTTAILLAPAAHSQDARGTRTATQRQKAVKEMDLGTIYIEAEVEKPRVALLPKRIRPDLGEIEFVDRDFRRELGKLPGRELILPLSLFQPRKIRPATELFRKR